MFYCDTCRKKHEWPTSMSKSRGSCEVCGENAVCNDLPSSRLPVSKAASAPPRENDKGLFVIRVNQTDGEKYLTYSDEEGGRALWWSVRLASAKIFTSWKEANKQFDELRGLGSKPNRMSDGTIFPHPLLQAALDISTTKPKASAEFAICEISLEALVTTTISGEIKKPTGFTYD